ncbi:MAG: hypothetical protein ACYCQI_15910 [Gammaproteobacteria bacterium]
MHPRIPCKSIRPSWSGSILGNRSINKIYQVGEKTCLLAEDYLIVLDANSKDKSATHHKIPYRRGELANAIPWSSEIILIDCKDKIISFNLKTLAFADIKLDRVDVAIGKMKSGDDDILITVTGFQTEFYLANDLSNLKLIDSFYAHYNRFGLLSADRNKFIMQTSETNAVIASFKDGKLITSEISTPDSLRAAINNGYICADEFFGNKFMLLNAECKITASANTHLPGVEEIIVLPDQQNFLCMHRKTNFLSLVKFKVKDHPDAKDELETTIFKLPGEKVKLAEIDADKARLITVLKGKDGKDHLCIFDDFQPLLEHREKLRKQFDATRSDVTLSLFSDRQRNVPMAIVDMVMGYAIKPRP